MTVDSEELDREKLLRTLDGIRTFLSGAPLDDPRMQLAYRVLRYLAADRPNLAQVASLWSVIAHTNSGQDAPQLTEEQLSSAHKNLRYIVQNANEPRQIAAAHEILVRSRFAEDGLATIADVAWLDDKRFAEAYRAGASVSVWGHDIRYRAYILMKCAERALSVPGDFIECGVDRGGTARCVIDYVGESSFAGRSFYLFDTYCGLVEDQLTEEELQMTRITDARYPNVLDRVRETFSPFDFVRIVPGAIPDTLPEFDGDQIAYLHIDMNAALPECAAFEAFWPRLSRGAPVIFDDYGFPFHAVQRHALDAMAERFGTQIIMLPTCQGLVWKT